MSILSDDAFVRFVQRHLGVTEDGLAGSGTQAALLKALGKTEPEPAPPLPKGVWDARSAKSLLGVHPDLVRVMERTRDTTSVPFVIIEGLRTVERQKQLFASGATRTMRSRHLTGHAVDIVPLREDGQIAFDWPLYNKLLPFVRHAAADERVAITLGADWPKFRDGPHIELKWSVYP